MPSTTALTLSSTNQPNRRRSKVTNSKSSLEQKQKKQLKHLSSRINPYQIAFNTTVSSQSPIFTEISENSKMKGQTRSRGQNRRNYSLGHPPVITWVPKNTAIKHDDIQYEQIDEPMVNIRQHTINDTHSHNTLNDWDPIMAIARGQNTGAESSQRLLQSILNLLNQSRNIKLSRIRHIRIETCSSSQIIFHHSSSNDLGTSSSKRIL